MLPRLPTIVKFAILWMIALKIAVCMTTEQSPPYELIYRTINPDTELSGLLELICRDEFTAEKLPVSDIKIWLNRTSVDDPDLREREDIDTIEVHGCCSLRFNLTHQLEGNYTCGRKTDIANVQESSPKSLISLQVIFPLTAAVQTTFTVISGDRIVLQCPIQPGALIKYYSVKWMKGDILIAEARNARDIVTMDSRYSIDTKSYSLVIDNVNSNDSSTDYQCALFITNPNTNARQQLDFSQPHNVFLTLRVLKKPNISSGPTNIVECNPSEQPSFNCVAIGPNAPNITWTYISNGGNGINLTDGDKDNYRIESNISEVEGGLYAMNSTITFLNVTANESAIVRCKIDILGAVSADALLVTIDCSTNKDVALSVELIALIVSLTAAVGVGLLFIVVTCIYCMQMRRTHVKMSQGGSRII